MRNIYYLTIPEFLYKINKYRRTRNFVWVDTETTGLGGCKKQQITQISGLATRGTKMVLSEFDSKIQLTPKFKHLTKDKTDEGIKVQEVLKMNGYNLPPKPKVKEKEALEKFHSWLDEIENPIFVAQNASFDLNMIEGRSKKEIELQVFDTKKILQNYMIPLFKKLAWNYKIPEYIEKLKKIEKIGSTGKTYYSASMSDWGNILNIDLTNNHKSDFDVEIMRKMFHKCLSILERHKYVDISNSYNSYEGY